MKTHTAFQLLLIFILLPGVFNRTDAQSNDGLNIEKFAAEERQAFLQLAATRHGAAETYRETSASTNFNISYYRCEWTIDPNIRFITGIVTSYFSITAATDKIVFDLSDTLTVDSVVYHGGQMLFQRNGNDNLQLQFPAVVNSGQIDSVAVYYHGVPRLNTGFKPFMQSTHNGAPVVWTLSEPYGAKEWWPCKNGLNDKADSIDITIRNPAAYQASSNGLMVNEVIAGGIKSSTWKHRYPIASYLVAMAVSNFAVLKDTVMIGGKPMEVIDYAFPEYAYFFDAQRPLMKKALVLYSSYFGDYPFAREKYGFTQYGAGGGMEHQTNTFLNYPTDDLVGHETGHQWFGDKITCGSWQDIWLNEGFATYCQVVFNQYVDTIYFPLILTNMIRDVTSLPGGSVWVDDTTSVSRIFNSRLSYEKGAYLLHMLRWKLGDDVFFRALKRYLNDPLLKYNYARTADLKRNLEQESGQDLTVFFQKWFYGQGYPNYNCTWRQNNNNWVYVQINQTSSDPSVSFYDMPVQLRFRDATHDTLMTVNNQRNGETFWINPGFMADTMLVDPKYNILAKDRISRKIPAISAVENDIKIFPNPAVNNLNVQLLNPGGSQISLRLYNTSGQLLYTLEKALNGQDELITIPVAKFAAGAYILNIADNKNMHLKKMIVK